MERGLPKKKAEELVGGIEVRLEPRICYACLSIVSMTLDCGERTKIDGVLRQMTPWLWGEGLAEFALDTVRRACDRGVSGAEIAFADLDARGGRSAVARAI